MANKNNAKENIMTASELRYLIAIDELKEKETGAKMTAVASNLNVSKVSVYKAVERLEAAGLVTHNGKRILISEKGRGLLEEYLVLMGFIHNHLKIHCGTPDDIAYNDALNTVAVLSDVSRSSLASFIKNMRKS